MKRYLIDGSRNQYKGNMHSHSTCSDGRYTPEELKEAYKARGYSVFAFSDHSVVRDHSDLNDENFLALSSAEIDFSQPGEEPFQVRQSCHFNIIARDPHNFEQIKYSGSYDFDRMNAIFREAKEKNYLVNINHPNWSLLNEDDFLVFENITGFELMNCITSNYGGALSYSYDLYINALRHGKKWVPIGGDDNHSFNKAFEHPLNDSFGAFTCFVADELTYPAIITALEKGDCYCSQGPRFKEIYVEDDTVHIRTSDAAKITMNADKRAPHGCVVSQDGMPVNEATFPIDRSRFSSFLIFDVTDFEGNRATTRGYYKDVEF